MIRCQMACAKQVEMAEISGRSIRQAMQLTIESDPIAVRNSLATLLACPILRSLDDATRDTAEIVLAEIFNNIVEHAYANDSGEINVTLHQQSDGIYVVVCDFGHPLPQGELPLGAPPPIDSSKGLPEGGFGWFLIRSLVQRLSYKRDDTCNQVSFLLPAQPNAGCRK
jgi:serine/threonine-protein kinase RsbW